MDVFPPDSLPQAVEPWARPAGRLAAGVEACRAVVPMEAAQRALGPRRERSVVLPALVAQAAARPEDVRPEDVRLA
jgi:hypothetical protein